MKKRNKQQSNSKRHRWPLMVGVAIVLLAGGAITVISRQNGASAKNNAAQTKPVAKNQRYVTVKVAGQDVQVDPQTGRMKPLSPEEARRIADGLKSMLNKSSEGLVQEQHPDGSVSMDLQDRFQNVAVARIESDGTVTESCIDNRQQAASFFGIDPALMGVERKEGTSAQQPATLSPAKKSRQ